MFPKNLTAPIYFQNKEGLQGLLCKNISALLTYEYVSIYYETSKSFLKNDSISKRYYFFQNEGGI